MYIVKAKYIIKIFYNHYIPRLECYSIMFSFIWFISFCQCIYYFFFFSYTGDQTKNQTNEDYYCEKCKCGFLKLFDFESHIQERHSGDNSLKCEISFSQKKTLNNHLLSYPGERPFVCHLCTKRFTLKRDLKRHLLVHSGERPFVCEQCDKHFPETRDLKRHLLIHSAQKPFGCDHCDKRYSRKLDLKRHLKIHLE